MPTNFFKASQKKEFGGCVWRVLGGFFLDEIASFHPDRGDQNAMEWFGQVEILGRVMLLNAAFWWQCKTLIPCSAV